MAVFRSAYQRCAARLGGGPDAALSKHATAAGFKLTHRSSSDADAIRAVNQIVNQSSVPVKPVQGVQSSSPNADAFGADSLGGKFPRSRRGNQFAVTFIDHRPGKRDPIVTCFATHEAANTVTALTRWLQRSQFPLKLDGTLQPNIHAYLDNGTELRGEFASLLERHAVTIHRATAGKKNTARVAIVENAHRDMQKKMRANLAFAKPVLDAWGLKKEDVWDSALEYACDQIYVEHLLSNVNTADPKATKIARDIVKRLLPGHFGQVVALTLQAGTSQRVGNKQLTDRATPAMFAGNQLDGTPRVLTSDGKYHASIDFRPLKPGAALHAIDPSIATSALHALYEDHTEVTVAALPPPQQPVTFATLDPGVTAAVASGSVNAPHQRATGIYNIHQCSAGGYYNNH
jgi:hypothetical protein